MELTKEHLELISDAEYLVAIVKGVPVILSEVKAKRNVFTPPTLEEVQKYCIERNNNVDAQAFIDYYTSKGWVVGKNAKVKDWKACVRTWERNNTSVARNNPSPYENSNLGVGVNIGKRY